MAYFDCQIVQGGGGIILVVTCNSIYAGATITATDGETTLQATCPSSSPYTVEFKIPNSGSWTISGTASGQTGSITVVIPDSATLNPPIPTGSTVTPVNDIQIWLHCAGIWDKAYTTIGQVLADASTLQALIASNNAADYMARSTSWASAVTANSSAMTYIGANNYCANKLLADSTWFNAICNSTYFESVLNVKVPTMTSNTAPFGEVSASGYYDTFYPWHAFNGSTASSSDCWYVVSSSGWLKYSFVQPIIVKRVMLQNRNHSTSASVRALKDFVIEGSNDNFTNDVHELGSYTNSNSGGSGVSWYDVDNNDAYTQIRLRFTSTYGSGETAIGRLQFYGRA